MQQHFDTTRTYRMKVPEIGIDGVRAPGDMQWQATFNRPAKNMAGFVEGIIYKNMHSKLVRQTVANKQSAKELLKCADIAAELKAIEEAQKPPKADETMAGAEEENDEAEPVDPRIFDSGSFTPTGVDNGSANTIHKYQEQARLLVNQSISLFVEPKDEADVVELLRTVRDSFEVPAATIEGMDRWYDLACYDVKSCGESVTHPRLRVMSFRAEHHNKLIGGFLRSLLPADDNAMRKDNFPNSAMVLTLDGGKYQG